MLYAQLTGLIVTVEVDLLSIVTITVDDTVTVVAGSVSVVVLVPEGVAGTVLQIPRMLAPFLSLGKGRGANRRTLRVRPSS